MNPNTSRRLIALKEATRKQIKQLGGLQATAENTRVSVSRLAQYQDLKSDSYMPIDILDNLNTQYESYCILQELARGANSVLLPLPEAKEGTLAIDFVKFGEESAKSFSDYHRAINQHENSDSQLTQEEIIKLRDDFEEILSVVQNMLSTLKRLDVTDSKTKKDSQ